MKDFRTGRRVARGWALFALAGVLAGGCGSSSSSDSQNQQTQTPVGAEDQERIEKGLVISPVTLNLTGLDRNLVGLGSYIVNSQGGCTDCHTYPPYSAGGDPFQGQPEQINTANFLAGGRPFGTGIVSRNITPDAQGLPSGLTYEAFLALMRTGREPGGALLQVMPWPIFAKMRDADLRAVYEYLRAIPAAQPGSVPTPVPPQPYP
ncbi:cytochrome C [Myxococcus sp. CA056]|nr:MULTISPECIES: cytochrome C [unclassified Myxococcus]NTX15219.1 cytochrome C [Myxococcus sp. CA056]NTX38028.1 cytochrome C [Myxococcus sp. CA033]NTX52995.1 cytochrome C [Myxococcus sp. CA039A]